MSQTGETAAIERVLAEPLAALSDGIGFVGPDVPIEALFASGRAFGHLPWRVDDHTPWADRWLESSFPFWARSILEQWHHGAFDALSNVVFSRGDDASQRLYYYVAELQRCNQLGGPAPLMFDVAHIRRASSVDYTVAAIRNLCRTLDVAPDALNDAIELTNVLRNKLAEIEAARRSHGPLHERLARAALWSDPMQWIDSIFMPAPDATGHRVLLAGSVPPDDRLHRAIEAAGADVVGEAHVFDSGRLGSQCPVDAESPERALASHLLTVSIAPRAMIGRAERVVERAVAARANTVMIWLTREDEALAWQVPALRNALAAAGLPALVLPAADWRCDDQTLERVHVFIEEYGRAAT